MQCGNVMVVPEMQTNVSLVHHSRVCIIIAMHNSITQCLCAMSVLTVDKSLFQLASVKELHVWN